MISKFSILLSSLLFSNIMLNADISIKSGWQNIGAIEDINISKFDTTCVDYIWRYNDTNSTNPWQLYIANGQEYGYIGPTLTSINQGQGLWIKANSECIITTDAVINSSETNTTTLPNNTTVVNSDGTLTFNGVVYSTVTSPFTGKIWLDRNLGASRVCTVSNDTDCYGDYYQWGRDADGHENWKSDTTSTIASTITAENGNFIKDSDWTSGDKYGELRSASWSKTDGTSICPVGYRVPTKEEVEAETTLASIPVTNITTAFNNFLKLPASGGRDSNLAIVTSHGTNGYIWTATTATFETSSYFLVFYTHSMGSSASVNDYSRGDGYPVRCIKD